jgi:16S rRNA processing protein RimM
MLLVVGQIARPHGIRGEVVVELHTDDPARRYAAGSVLQVDADQPPSESEPDPSKAAESRVPGRRWRAPPKLVVHAARPHQSRLIVAFEGVDDRNTAEELRGRLLYVDSADAAPLDDPDEFHDHQLVGLVAFSPDGERLGAVVRVEHAPAGELLVLQRPDGGSALVPCVKAIVTEVDLAGGRILMDPPEGLLEL